MVGMFVSDQDPVQPLRRAADRGETLADLAATEAGVNEQAGLIGLQISTVAAGTAAQNGKSNGHDPDGNGRQGFEQCFSKNQPTEKGENEKRKVHISPVCQRKSDCKNYFEAKIRPLLA